MVLEVPFTPPRGDEWLWYPSGVAFGEPAVQLQGAGGSRVLRDVQGHEAPVYTYTSSSTPGADGVYFDDTVTATRPRLVVPVLLWARSSEHLDEVKSALVAALSPKRGTGRLLRKRNFGQLPDQGEVPGRARYVRARYRGGLEGDGTAVGPNWWRIPLTFECSDPCWYSVDPIQASWVGRPDSAPFFPFRFPFRLSQSGVLVREPLVVQGDAGTWPSFDLRGPFTRVRAAVDGRPAFWEINRQTNPSETLRLVTKPNEESLRLLTTTDGVTWADAGSVWSAMTDDSWLTPLEFLENLTVTCEGTTRDTLITLTAEEAWNLS